MTSPLSSLGKIRRMPFNMHSQGKRAVPFKESAPNEAAPTDMELMTSMMQKIASLEQKVKNQAHVIHHKDKKIKELEERMKILQQGNDDSSGLSRVEELEVICLQLQHQIWEMERFLNDYGLIWVGEGNESPEDESLDRDGHRSSRGLWKPGDSVVPESSINFDTIFENLKDLNVLAGEGVSQIEHVAGGARLRQLDPVPLTFYQNGIVMFNGPFRSYEEPSTQQCLRDLMDGYFPSELQRRYPDGIPFQVTDKRDVFFRERQLPESFPGQGQIVGHPKPSGMKETTEIPGPKLTVEQFMNRLPRSLIRDGQVIDIRGEIRETLQGSSGTQKHEVILVETPSLMAMKKRLEGDSQEKTPDPHISTLRIKSENGEKTYIIKMPFTETIGDLRQHLARSRGGELESYEILSIFPQKVYSNNSVTLEECGLVPNGALLLRRKAPPPKLQGQQL
ncbi:UBX domain-containing protein 11 isoform X2 [Eublepharis macularius]|uniref:UBX domain-containing protein 11 n=1 Tax=Eublepharis macularius TaxID=481883 RepID=A0AA97KG48_EUBMA|nr:UBX domain-containing protein 11 isoform X2 [Eublepharis macularius]